MSNRIYNKDAFLEQTAGSLDIAGQVVDIYLRDYNKELEAFRQAIEQDDLDALRRLAHKSKSGFLIMGCSLLHQMALNMEQLAKLGNPSAKASFQEFDRLSRQLAEELKSDFNR